MGHLELVSWLLPKAPSLLSLADGDGRSALLHASANGHLEVVEWLVEQGAEPSREALRAAQEEGHPKVVKLLKKLLKGASGASSSGAK